MKTKLKVLLNAVLIKSARQRLKMKMLVTLLIFLFSEHRKINLHFIKGREESVFHSNGIREFLLFPLIPGIFPPTRNFRTKNIN